MRQLTSDSPKAAPHPHRVPSVTAVRLLTHPGLRHSWMSDTQAFTCRASTVSRMYSEGPSTYGDKRRPTGHFQVRRPLATPADNKNTLPAFPPPGGATAPQTHSRGPGQHTGTSCHQVPCFSVLSQLSPQNKRSPRGQEPRAPTLTTNVFSRSGISRAVVVRTSVMVEQGMLSRGRDA